MAKLRYAMVGGGVGAFIGAVHREALRAANLADLVAGMFNRDPAQNASVAESLGLPADRLYGSWEALVDAEGARDAATRPDFLAICTPNALHYETAKRAIEAGMHVMCEKPMTLTLAEARDLRALAAAKGRVLGLMHAYTGYPMVKLARDLVRAGELGRICKVQVEYQQGSFRRIDFTKPLDKRNRWKMDPAQSGPSCCMGDIGVHAVHLLRYVTGLEIEELLAEISSFAPGNPLDDDGSVLLRLTGGARGVLMASKVASGELNGLRLRVYGEKRSLVWHQETPDSLQVLSPLRPVETWQRGSAYVAAVSPAAARVTRLPSGHPTGVLIGFMANYAEFCAAIRGEEKREFDFPNADDGVKGQAFIEAVLESSRAGGGWAKMADA